MEATDEYLQDLENRIVNLEFALEKLAQATAAHVSDTTAHKRTSDLNPQPSSIQSKKD